MTGKIIKHASELPQWFDLKKYAGAETLDTTGWYEQLAIRRDLKLLIGSPRWLSWQGDTTPPPSARQTLEVLALLRATPILDISQSELLKYYFPNAAVRRVKELDQRYAIGIHLTTVRDLYRTEARIERDKKSYAREYFDQEFGKPKSDKNSSVASKAEDWLDDPVDRITNKVDFELNFRANILLPNKILIEQFTQLLNELRSPGQQDGLAIANTKAPAFNDWINFGLLPFLDLQIWQQETGNKIPNRVLADAIFTAGEGGEEVVRKTTSKLAKEVITFRHLLILASLASNEIAERKAD